MAALAVAAVAAVVAVEVVARVARVAVKMVCKCSGHADRRWVSRSTVLG